MHHPGTAGARILGRGGLKRLARQTVRATNDLGKQIGQIRKATIDAVDAIREIMTKIETVSTLAIESSPLYPAAEHSDPEPDRGSEASASR